MEEIQLTLEENIATVTINRPSVKNAVTSEMWDELQRTFIDLGYRDDVRAVIVTGAGDDFCSGADVSGMASRNEGPRVHQLESMRKVGDCCLSLFNMPKVCVKTQEILNITTEHPPLTFHC